MNRRIPYSETSTFTIPSAYQSGDTAADIRAYLGQAYVSADSRDGITVQDYVHPRKLIIGTWWGLALSIPGLLGIIMAANYDATVTQTRGNLGQVTGYNYSTTGWVWVALLFPVGLALLLINAWKRKTASEAIQKGNMPVEATRGLVQFTSQEIEWITQVESQGAGVAATDYTKFELQKLEGYPPHGWCLTDSNGNAIGTPISSIQLALRLRHPMPAPIPR